MRPDNGIIIVTASNGRIGDAVMRRFAGRFAVVAKSRMSENDRSVRRTGSPTPCSREEDACRD